MNPLELIYTIVYLVEPATLNRRATYKPLVALPSRNFQRSPMVIALAQKFLKTSAKLVTKLPDTNQTTTMTHNDQAYHITVSSDVIFIVISGKNFDKELAYRCLSDIKGVFMQRYDIGRFQSSSPLGLNDDFETFALQKMEYFSNPQTVKIRAIEKEVKEVKDIMFDQVQSNLVARQEKLEDLEVGTDELTALSKGMRKETTKMKWKYCSKLLKNKILAVLICCAIIFILLFLLNGIIGCGFVLEKCLKR